MSKQFSFNDKALNQAIKVSASRFTNFQKLLDETSEDIRNLEKWLQECGICITRYVRVDSETAIGWDKQGDQWRLMCELDREMAPVESRPLAETSAKIRIMCKSHLATLVTEMSQLLPEADEQPPDPNKKVQLFIKDSKPATKSKAEDIDAIFKHTRFIYSGAA